LCKQLSLATLGEEKRRTKHARVIKEKKKKKREVLFSLKVAKREREREREEEEEGGGGKRFISRREYLLSLSLSLSLSLFDAGRKSACFFSLRERVFVVRFFVYINTYKREGERVRVCARARVE